MAEKTVVLRPDKQCKGSVRYATDDDKSPVRSIYVERSFADPMPEAVTVTIAAGALVPA